MKTLRRTLATAAASLLAVTALAPAASAQRPLDILIDKAPCEVVKLALTNTGLIDNNTTRGGLVRNLGAHVGQLDLGFGLKVVAADYAGKIGDKALTCKLVKPDAPELFPGSSQISDLFLTLSSK